jgi:hypothetical protein
VTVSLPTPVSCYDCPMAVTSPEDIERREREARAAERIGAEFWSPPSLRELAMRQGIGPTHDAAALATEIWEEDLEEFLTSLAAWRQEQ